MRSHDYAFLRSSPLEIHELSQAQAKISDRYDLRREECKLQAEKMALKLFQALPHSRQVLGVNVYIDIYIRAHPASTFMLL